MKKAWMTAATMEEWLLNMFNAKMKKENRNAILFHDIATCHPKVTLSNVKIAWFLANATSVLQIIWRRRVKTLLQYLISAEGKNFPVILCLE
jgi:hypothetical protein